MNKKTYEVGGYTYEYEAKKKNLKPLIITIGVVILLCVVAVFTNPSASKHQQELSSTLTSAIGDYAQNEAKDNAYASAFISMIANPIADVLASTTSDYHNYWVCSTNSVTFRGKTQTVSFGLFGKVFIIDKEQIIALMS